MTGDRFQTVSLAEVLSQGSSPERIVDMQNERYITVSINGKGARERVIKDGKYPVPFTGYRVSSGQFIYSRIDARNGAYGIVGPELDGFVVSKDFPVFDIDTQRVNPQFLLKSVLGGGFLSQVRQSSFGATNRMRIKEEVLGQFSIGLPPLARQEEIIGILDRAQAVVDARQAQLQKLDELVKARFVEMFGTICEPHYPVVEIERLCSCIVDCPHETPKYEGELIHPAIRTSELKGSSIDWSSMRYVSESEYQQRIKRMKPMPGDIVYAREGTYGDAAILPTGYEFCLGQRTMLFRASADVCMPEYLLHALISPDVKRQADELNVGSTVPHVNVRDAKRFKVMCPNLDIQQEFAAFVAQVDKSGAAVRKALEEAQLLFDSLMQKYFG